MEWEEKYRTAIREAFKFKYNIDRIAEDKMIGMLQALENHKDNGFGRLLKSFRTNASENRVNARNDWFEIMVASQLLQYDRIQNLKYEPNNKEKTPDFCYSIGDRSFMLEVKRQYHTRFFLVDVIYEQLINNGNKPLCIEFWVSEGFKVEEDRGPFVRYLSPLIANFKPSLVEQLYTNSSVFETINNEPQLSDISKYSYQWPNDSVPLVKFSIELGEEPLVFPKYSWGTGDPEPLDSRTWSKIQDNLVNSSKKFHCSKTSGNTNIVIIQSAGYTKMDPKMMAEALYCHPLHAENGLFYDKDNDFSIISGVILADGSHSTVAVDLKGFYYPNPMHKDYLVYPEMPFPNVVKYKEATPSTNHDTAKW